MHQVLTIANRIKPMPNYTGFKALPISRSQMQEADGIRIARYRAMGECRKKKCMQHRKVQLLYKVLSGTQGSQPTRFPAFQHAKL